MQHKYFNLPMDEEQILKCLAFDLAIFNNINLAVFFSGFRVSPATCIMILRNAWILKISFALIGTHTMCKNQNAIIFSTWPQVFHRDDVITTQKLQDLGTPSAPPIVESRFGIEDQQCTDAYSVTQEHDILDMDQTSNEKRTLKKDCYGSQEEVLSDQGMQIQKRNDPGARFFFLIYITSCSLYSGVQQCKQFMLLLGYL